MIVLRYVLPGCTFHGVPACDLTQEMIDATGLTIEEILALHVGNDHLYKRVEVEVRNVKRS